MNNIPTTSKFLTLPCTTLAIDTSEPSDPSDQDDTSDDITDQTSDDVEVLVAKHGLSIETDLFLDVDDDGEMEDCLINLRYSALFSTQVFLK